MQAMTSDFRREPVLYIPFIQKPGGKLLQKQGINSTDQISRTVIGKFLIGK